MTKREPFAKWVLETDRSYFIYAAGVLLDFATAQDSAEERCERLNLAFEKAVAERVKEKVEKAIKRFREAARRARMKLHCDLCGGNDRSHTAECPISIAAERTSRRIKSIREAKDGK